MLTIRLKIYKELSEEQKTSIIKTITKNLNLNKYITVPVKNQHIIRFKKKIVLNSNGWEVYHKQMNVPHKGLIKFNQNKLVLKLDVEKQIIFGVTITILTLFFYKIELPSVNVALLTFLSFYFLFVLLKCYYFIRMIQSKKQ